MVNGKIPIVEANICEESSPKSDDILAPQVDARRRQSDLPKRSYFLSSQEISRTELTDGKDVGKNPNGLLTSPQRAAQ
jgi:hypothetical protein